MAWKPPQIEPSSKTGFRGRSIVFVLRLNVSGEGRIFFFISEN